jgi:uncharacterized protein
MAQLSLGFLALYGCLGIVAGLLAGLLGVGGGLIIVPALTYLFEAQGFPRQGGIQLALGTSLATILFTSLSSARAHHKNGFVEWPLVKRIAPGILVGTYLGGLLALRVDSTVLKAVFTVFLFIVALQMLSGAKPRPTRTLPGAPGTTGVGFAIGGISSWVGIGGGSMSVPFMLWCNVEPRRAVGTSAAIGFPIAFAGALTYVVNGLGANTGVPHAVGFIHLPALVGISVLSMSMAPLGASLAARLDPARVKRWFACFLLVVAAKMLYSLAA